MVVAVTPFTGDVAGFCAVHPFGQDAEYTQLAMIIVYTNPEWYGKGVSGKLQDEFHNGGWLRGMRWIWSIVAFVRKGNEFWRRRLTKLGYTKLGESEDAKQSMYELKISDEPRSSPADDQ